MEAPFTFREEEMKVFRGIPLYRRKWRLAGLQKSSMPLI